MARFVDSNGNEWTLRLKVGHRKPLADLGVTFDPKDFGPSMGAILAASGDPEMLAKVIHTITVDPPTTAAKLYESIDTPTYAAGIESLTAEVADFFHPGRPQTAAAAIQAVKTVLGAEDQKKAELLTRSLSATNSPESPESIPQT